ncbi:hypothetical protein HIM_06928 [Hirsutella minnesotensis 3608]|uniref:RRM domain-containing protein n=1 Tax=Hirsutella minnesotensis 3608 TaxID=1043627 RepID=A0A0F7ZNE2_9HYPO|nr:hypothetical protein HIM_06928 [Hirsutella minnesotensis 3608]
MADKMDRGLDEIIADNRSSGPRNRRGGGNFRRRERQDYPRDGVRKQSTRSDSRNDSRYDDRNEPRREPRNIDSEWVHDRFEENNSRRGPATRRRRESPAPSDQKGSKLRVENIHYDLTEEDLDELFARIGPVVRLQLLYDRAGRSEGTAYVTYESREDALEAVKQFDGANANGQPIRLNLIPSGPARNPFDTAVMPGRPLAERISAPGGRSRSLSPHRRHDEEDAARKGIDRYIPGSGSRSRSPAPPRRGGRRPGTRREGDVRESQPSRGTRGNPRTKKTQEELDAEMEDYFGGNGQPASAPSNGNAPAAAADDIDMIE